jgi:hypothetical protein
MAQTSEQKKKMLEEALSFHERSLAIGEKLSIYVDEEVRCFKALGRQDPILTLIIDGEPNASDGNRRGFFPEEECFCPALRDPLDESGNVDVSPRDAQDPIAGAVPLKLSLPPKTFLSRTEEPS